MNTTYPLTFEECEADPEHKTRYMTVCDECMAAYRKAIYRSTFGQHFASGDDWPEPEVEKHDGIGPTASHDVGGEPWRSDQT